MLSSEDQSQPLLSDIMTKRLRSDRLQRDAADAADRRKPSVDRAVADAQAAAILRMALADLGDESPVPERELAHCLAAVLAATRQSFFQVTDLSDRRLQEALPFISHLSGLAESMVGIAGQAVVNRTDGRTASKPGSGQTGSAGARNGLRGV